MEKYQILKNKIWMVHVLPELGLHYYLNTLEFSLNYDNNKVFFNCIFKSNRLNPYDLENFITYVLNEKGWEKIQIDECIFGKQNTKYLGYFIKNISKILNKPIKEIQIDLIVNNITYSKYKLKNVKSYKYKSINDYYYDFTFEQI